MRIVHKGALFSKRGVSALCSGIPRAINMKTSTWVLADEAVTCKRCIAKLKALSHLTGMRQRPRHEAGKNEQNDLGVSDD